MIFFYFFLFQVNNGSPAEAAGLRAGDAVVRVNSTEVFSLRHKDAQDVIVRAGNNFEVTVQRYVTYILGMSALLCVFFGSCHVCAGFSGI